ncbi:uncharacterized protein LOC116179569 [Photinus pyralis]|uniref:uncharacterized protein LOC116179569 n=1 Tax=Photinus pyralis TaxID=7054 RepID=UPI001266E7D5|nr:uncharacterized protein LOC116179569 [Photinus pyralis]
MRRNNSLSIRKAQGLSNARAEGMNKKECNEYFELLLKTLTEHDLINKPGSIWNVDESGLQLNNEPGIVVAKKGSDVHVRQSTERGETVTVVACANAEGTFLPPFCIFKGVKKQQVWQESMPSGAAIEMRKESAYIDENIFMKWFRDHFLPRKPAGKCLLLLDGPGSHTNSPDILECASSNDVVLLCLPSHTTQYLQPLDRSFFKPLKAHYRHAAGEWGNANPGKKLERRHFGELLGQAWSKSATVRLGVSGFRACGVYPFKPTAIADDAFLATTDYDSPPSDQESNYDDEGPLPSTSSDPSTAPSTSKEVTTIIVTPIKDSPIEDRLPCRGKPTPTKLLLEVSPIPTPVSKKPSSRKQSAQVLTSPEVMADKTKKRLALVERKKKTEEKKLTKGETAEENK